MSIQAARVRLQTFAEVAVTQEDLDLIFRKRPYVWRTSEKSMRHSANYLRNNLGLSEEELRLLVLRDPLIISLTKVIDILISDCQDHGTWHIDILLPVLLKFMAGNARWCMWY